MTRKRSLVRIQSCFGGLTVEETAEVLGVSERTVEREWSLARAWLYTRLKPRTQPG